MVFKMKTTCMLSALVAKASTMTTLLVMEVMVWYGFNPYAHVMVENTTMPNRGRVDHVQAERLLPQGPRLFKHVKHVLLVI